jgi:hypothetical protein
MVKPTPPIAPEAPLRSDPAFSTKAQTFLTWLAGGFYSYVEDSVDFVDERADEALAAATTFGFPSIAGKALNFTRVNSGATALEFRTPAQVRDDIGVPFDRISQGNLSGAGLSVLVPTEYDAIELTYWNYVPSVTGTVLNFAVGSGTLGSPTFGANHFEQIQSIVGTTYTPGNNTGLAAVSASFAQINSDLGSGRIFAAGFNSVGRIQGEMVRRGVTAGPVRASSTGTFGEATDVNNTLFSLYVSSGSLTGKYRLMGYRK